MDLKLSKEQAILQKKLRAYVAEIMSDKLRNELGGDGYGEGGGPEFRKAMRQFGEDGYICMGWPKHLGGGGVTPVEQYIFNEELLRVGFPYPFLTTDAVGPVLAEHAGPEIQDTVVEGVRKGEVIIAIGYSEPNAGTDLAALKTRAKKEGDEWLINGQKIWTSLANYSDYVWLAARTDPDERKRHKGLSMFIVPCDAPGFSVTPIHTLGVRTNATYYQDIRLPGYSLVGEENKGWKLITGQLNRERLALVNHSSIDELMKKIARWAAETPSGTSGLLIDQPWVQHNLAKVKVGLEALRLICWKQAWSMNNETLDMAQASAAKIYGSEFFIEAYRLLMEISGQAGGLAKGSIGTVLEGGLEHRYRTGSILTFGGGTNEIQRDIIAMAGLSMPRYAR